MLDLRPESADRHHAGRHLRRAGDRAARAARPGPMGTGAHPAEKRIASSRRSSPAPPATSSKGAPPEATIAAVKTTADGDSVISSKIAGSSWSGSASARSPVTANGQAATNAIRLTEPDVGISGSGWVRVIGSSRIPAAWIACCRRSAYRMLGVRERRVGELRPSRRDGCRMSAGIGVAMAGAALGVRMRSPSRLGSARAWALGGRGGVVLGCWVSRRCWPGWRWSRWRRWLVFGGACRVRARRRVVAGGWVGAFAGSVAWSGVGHAWSQRARVLG